MNDKRTVAWGSDNSDGRWLGFLASFLLLVKFVSFNKDNFKISWVNWIIKTNERN